MKRRGRFIHAVAGAWLVLVAAAAAARAEVPLDQLLARLASGDEATRQAALQEVGGKKWSVADGIQILHAAATLPANARTTGDADTCNELISLLISQRRPEYIAPTVENFAGLTPYGRDAAFSLLEALDSPDAARAVVQIVKSDARAGNVTELSLIEWERKGAFGDALFPALLDYVDVPSLGDDIYSLFLSYCEKKQASGSQLLPRLDTFLARERDLEEKLRPLQQDHGVGWMYAKDYAPDRERLSVVLDLAGYVPAGDKLDSALSKAMELRDPRIKHFAAIALLKHGRAVPAAELRAVAADGEMRNWLYRALKELGRTDLFPPEFKKQEAFAESEMVYWLIYPTELGRAPDQIELMKVIWQPSANQTLDYYVFRFRTLPPHWSAKDGWMAGIAGPFRRGHDPTPDGGDDTFSSFEPWGSRTPEGHLNHRLKLKDQAPVRSESAP